MLLTWYGKESSQIQNEYSYYYSTCTWHRVYWKYTRNKINKKTSFNDPNLNIQHLTFALAYYRNVFILDFLPSATQNKLTKKQ